MILFVEREDVHGPTNTKSTKNLHAIRKQQRRHTIADQSSLSFIKPLGLWKHSRRQSMFKNTLPTVSGFLLLHTNSMSMYNNYYFYVVCTTYLTFLYHNVFITHI